MLSTRPRRAVLAAARLLAAGLLACAAGCGSDDHERPSGRYRAQESTGGTITLDFIGEGAVAMAFGDAEQAKRFARVCSCTWDDGHLTITDASVEKTLELELDGDALVGNGLIFEKQ